MQSLNIIWPGPGAYILAVSGGADSMVLLDIFARAAGERGYELTVAHVDHGLRPESAADLKFVRTAAARRGLRFESHSAALAVASEASARAARHGWLEQTRARLGAAAVITAHHQDDLVETSLLNLARGSGRRGLAPMAFSATILRPLLNATRGELRVYAKAHKITWREDPTNAEITNPRNFLRHKLLAAASSEWRTSYLENVRNLAALNKKLAQSISEILESARTSQTAFTFARNFVRALPEAVFEELLLAGALALVPGVQLDRKLLTEMAVFARTGLPAKHRPLRQGLFLTLSKDSVNLTTNAPR